MAYSCKTLNVCKCVVELSNDQIKKEAESQSQSNIYCSCSKRQCPSLKRAELGNILKVYHVYHVYSSLYLCYLFFCLTNTLILFCFVNLSVQQCLADSTMSSDSDATIGYNSDSEPYFITDEESADKM